MTTNIRSRKQLLINLEAINHEKTETINENGVLLKKDWDSSQEPSISFSNYAYDGSDQYNFNKCISTLAIFNGLFVKSMSEEIEAFCYIKMSKSNKMYKIGHHYNNCNDCTSKIDSICQNYLDEYIKKL